MQITSKVIVDIIEKEAKFELIGFIDNNLEIGTKVLGYEVIGPESSLNQIITNNDVFGGIIGIGDNARRAIVKDNIPDITGTFIHSIGITLGLCEQGIHTEHITELGQLAFEDSCHATHPFAVNQDDFHAVYTRAL